MVNEDATQECEQYTGMNSTLWPEFLTASVRSTNSSSLDEVPSSRSKKMPPRKGRKNSETMAGLKPSSCTG